MYTAFGSMVYNLLKYSIVKATMAAASACSTIHKKYVISHTQTVTGVLKGSFVPSPTRKPNSAIVSERLTKIDVTPNNALLRGKFATFHTCVSCNISCTMDKI